MAGHRFERSALTPIPWKNGGGVTREIVCRPTGAGMDAFDWRVSIADIAADGPFSTFAGVDRVIVLLDGGGVRLRSTAGDVDHRLEVPLAPFAFDGGVDITSTLLSGPSTDFNVMTRRATHEADVRVIQARHTLEPSVGGVLLAVHGTWHTAPVFHSMAIFSKGSDPVPAGMGIWWDETPLAWQCEPRSEDAALIAVRISPCEPRGDR